MAIAALLRPVAHGQDVSAADDSSDIRLVELTTAAPTQFVGEKYELERINSSRKMPDLIYPGVGPLVWGSGKEDLSDSASSELGGLSHTESLGFSGDGGLNEVVWEFCDRRRQASYEGSYYSCLQSVQSMLRAEYGGPTHPFRPLESEADESAARPVHVEWRGYATNVAFVVRWRCGSRCLFSR